MAISKQKKGFVLLYAILVAGIALTIGLSLSTIFYKQLILSSITREFQFAYYAADSARECAYFWDFYQGAFTSSPPPSLFCNGTNALLQSDGGYLVKFADSVSGADRSCAEVYVQKSGSGEDVTTTIISNGFNTCDLTSSRRLERTLKFSY